jgi:DcaP outer membrane protein
MKPLFTRATLALITLTVAGAARAQDSSAEVNLLKAQMQVMQKTLADMQRKLAELEGAKSGPAAPALSPTGAVTFDTPATPVAAKPSPVADRENMNDQQEDAPRLNDLILDPQYHGFIPIPNTDILIKFNAKPRVDMMEDSRNSGNPDRFVTATIPVEGSAGYGGGSVFNATSKGSSLSAEIRAPNLPGNPRFVYNNDFFGGGSGMAYRLKQLYGTIFNVTAGFTFSVWEDPDMWPDTVDFEGPNSAIFARQPTVRYMVDLGDKWQMNLGIQQASSDIDTVNTDASAVNHLPDVGVNFRWEDKESGHIQISGILRDLGANSPTLGNQTVTGWGLSAAASLNVFAADSVQGQVTYGDGIFHFVNDNFTYSGFNGGDAAFDSHGKLQAMEHTTYLFGYTHKWSDEWRSTVTYGHVHLLNQASESPEAYHETSYYSGNLVWQMRKRLSVGMEVLYGEKIQKDNAKGDVWRFQTGMVYSIF